MEIREITYTQIMLRIFAAFILGGLIGVERGLKNRPAGMRTYMLVCVGSCLIMLTNQYIYQAYQYGDPVRMGAQVVSGIGFLGAGTIIVTKRNQIRGLTTAAGLWAAAAVGLALGIGFYEGAIIGGGAVFLILTVLHRLDSKMHRNSRVMEIYIEVAADVSLGSILHQIRALNVEIENVQLDCDNLLENGGRSFIFTLKQKNAHKRLSLLDGLGKAEGILFAEEL